MGRSMLPKIPLPTSQVNEYSMNRLATLYVPWSYHYSESLNVAMVSLNITIQRGDTTIMDQPWIDSNTFQSWIGTILLQISTIQLLLNLGFRVGDGGGNADPDTRYEILEMLSLPPPSPLIYGDIFTRYKWTRRQSESEGGREKCQSSLWIPKERGKNWPQITHQTCRQPFIPIWMFCGDS